MQIKNLSANYIYNNLKVGTRYSMPVCSDTFVKSTASSQCIDKKISFSRLFLKKQRDVQSVKNISMGSNLNLKTGQSIEIPKELFSIHFNSSKSIDLNSFDISNVISSLNDGDSFSLKGSPIDSEEVLIYKKENSLYLENKSKSEITLVSDSCYKNYNKDSLKAKFQREIVPFYLLLAEKYNEIRHSKYDEKITFPCGRTVLEQVSKEGKPNLMVITSDGWLYRIPKVKSHSKDDLDCNPQRISLNVVANPALIDELDELFLTGKYTDENHKHRKVNKSELGGINYKVPYRAESWLKRHDPVTIYKTDSFSSDLIDAIASISQKYQRITSNNVALVGALPSKPWIALEKDPSEEEFLKIKNIAEKYNPNLADAMCQQVYEKWNHQDGYVNFSASTGMVNSCRFLLDEYIEYLKFYSNK